LSSAQTEVYNYESHTKNIPVHVPQTLQTGVFWKADGERRLLDLLFKKIFLVQKQYDRCVSEPLAVARRVKQTQTFLHSILYRNIQQYFVQATCDMGGINTIMMYYLEKSEKFSGKLAVLLTDKQITDSDIGQQFDINRV